jgi:hypothetical protein
LLVDNTRLPPLTPMQRRRTADFLREVQPRAAAYFAGAAVVLSSPIQRGILTAVLWIFTPPYPMRAFADVREARGWLLDRLSLGTGRSGGSATV